MSRSGSVNLATSLLVSLGQTQDDVCAATLPRLVENFNRRGDARRVIGGLRERFRESWRTLRAVFANPSLRKLELGRIAATLSASGGAVVYVLLAYRAGGAGAVAALIVVTTWTAAIASPIASIPADRFPRQGVIVVADCARILVLLTTAAVAVDGRVWVVIVLAATVTVIGTASSAARAALVPVLASDSSQLLSANVVASTMSSGTYLVGPVVAGAAVAIRGPAAALVTFACASLASAVAAFGLEDPGGEEPARGRSLGAGSIAGLRALVAAPAVRVVVFLTAAQTFVGGAFGVLLVVAAIETLDLGETGPSVLATALSAGTLLGSLLLLLLGERRLGATMAVGLAMWGLSASLIGIAPTAMIGVTLIALIGLGDALADITALTIVQRLIPNDVLATALGALRGLFFTLTSLGSLVAPLLVELVGVRIALLISGLIVPVGAFAFWPLLSAAATAPPSASVELLRGVPFFSVLPVGALERLAAVAQRLEVEEDAVIVREGETDRGLYVIVDGEVAVDVSGRVVSTLGAGEHFGEVASLRDSPRTATVRATARGELLFIPDDEFLAALAADEAAYGAAERVVAGRLARVV